MLHRLAPGTPLPQYTMTGGDMGELDFWASVRDMASSPRHATQYYLHPGFTAAAGFVASFVIPFPINVVVGLAGGVVQEALNTAMMLGSESPWVYKGWASHGGFMAGYGIGSLIQLLGTENPFNLPEFPLEGPLMGASPGDPNVATNPYFGAANAYQAEANRANPFSQRNIFLWIASLFD
jgi:hypothetical protein